MRRVCVFCGSSHGARAEYGVVARQLGDALVDHGLGLVYGGGNVGLMGEIANAVVVRGGEAIGVIPEQLVAMEVAHQGLSALHVVDTMHARKAMMAELADAFIALPGGMGTLEELFEVLTWAQLGYHRKPAALIDAGGYWRPLLDLLDHAEREGFVQRRHRALLSVANDATSLLRSWGASS